MLKRSGRKPIAGAALMSICALALLACSPADNAADNRPADAASASMAASTATDCEYPDARGHPAPVWVCNGVFEGAAATAIGVAEPSQAGTAFDRSMALADARAGLLERLAGDDRAGTIAVNLVGSRVLATATSPHGRIYALVGLLPVDAGKN